MPVAVSVGEGVVTAVGTLLLVIITSSVEIPQRPLSIVQRKVADAPNTNPVNPDVGEVGVVIVAVPDTNVHVPVNPAEAGVFPARVAVDKQVV